MSEIAIPPFSSFRYLQGGGEMGHLTRSFDWCNTILGSPDGWSQSLLTTVGMMLKSKFPMFLWWGTDLVQFYNDAYRPSLGNNGKHPKALGQKGEDSWPEIWPEIKPMIDLVMNFSESTWDEDRLLPIYRNGHMEDVYWTFSYSPVNDGAGNIGGVLVIGNETTQKVKAHQDLKLAKDELIFQNQEKESRAAEFVIANTELAFENHEKEKRATELIAVNKRLILSSKEIEQSEARFRNVVEQAINPILILKGETLILELANEPLFKVWNVQKDAIGKPFLEILPEMKDQQFEKLLLDVLRNGVTHYGNEHPAHFARENGETHTVYFDFVYQPYRESDGSVSGIIVQAHDVTLQFNARKEIEKREINLVIANKELAFENQEKENRAAELVIANKELAFENQEKENRAAELVIANKELAFENREKENRATELLKANNELISITKALSESEILFRSMMDTISQMAWTLTAEAEATFFNQQWYNYTGLDHRQTKVHDWQAIIHPDDLQKSLERFRIIRNDNSSAGTNEVRYKRADGKYRWHLVSTLPIINEYGEVRLWIVSATDIQDLKELQQQKDDFISIASHELKTPLTTLTASLQLLNKMKDNPSHKMFPSLIERSNKSLDKLNILIKDLLNASRYSDGQLHVNKEQFIISKMIDDCFTHIRVEGFYSIKTEGDMNLQISADRERVGQVLINFVNNAIKYAPDSKEVLINIEKIDNMAKVSVIDQGIGIPAEKIPQLFDRYFRVDNSGKQYSGLGLGLYISAEIIKKHGGQIGADSTLGKGSTFWFTLPFV